MMQPDINSDKLKLHDQTEGELPLSLADVLLYPMNGSLLELWSRWPGRSQEPPRLSLAGTGGLEKLLLTGREAREEAARLSRGLELAARLRLEALEQREEAGLAPDLDANCLCWVARNKMVAWLFVFPPVGEGGSLTVADVGRAMEHAGIRAGLDSAAVLRAAGGSCMELTPAAVGVDVIEGIDGRCRDRFFRQVDRESLVLADGTVDYSPQRYFQPIQAGTLICQLREPVSGQDGLTVTGQVLTAHVAQAVPLPRGRRVSSSRDGLELMAAQTGNVIYADGGFSVMQVKELRGDVDRLTGSVSFDGDIHITGSVRSGMKVRAGGSIYVDGLIEAARLTAGGDIVGARGVVGENSAVLRCGRDLHTKYLENCTVQAGGSIYTDCALACELSADDTICADHGQGSLIGGELKAGRGVRASSLGSRAGNRTSLELGAADYLKQTLALMDRDLEELAATLEETRQAAAQGSDQSRTRVAMLELEQREKLSRRDRLKARLPSLADCFVDCDVIYPATRLKAGDSVQRVDSTWENFGARYDEKTGELHIFTK